MSRLRIYADDQPEQPLAEHSDGSAIAGALKPLGVRFERWPVRPEIRPGDAPEAVLTAYRDDIDRMMAEGGYKSVDVVSLSPEHPDKDLFRRKFLDEHRHAEDEVRFFVAGHGLFSLHIENRVYEVLCKAGDFISVPAGTPHWFDMGPNPSFVAIRIFTNPEGWVAQFTGTAIAAAFPRLDN